MNKTQAVTTSKRITGELLKLNGDLIITLFIIDYSSLVFNPNSPPFDGNTILRFHNNIKTITNNIIWDNNVYHAAPILAEGFEYNSKGTLVTPKLSLSIPDASSDLFKLFKKQFRYLDNDIVGAKVTRIRTFAKFLDAINFTDETRPEDFDPDPNAELSRDIYYINRKSYEDKTILEFELASFFDLNGILLPQRVVFANRCPFSYRGEGCLYEYDNDNNSFFQRRVAAVHGATSVLPDSAPPVATVNNELIFGDILRSNQSYVDKGEFDKNQSYIEGDGVYIQKDGIKYYFVARRNVTPSPQNNPPNEFYWVSDECSHDIRGCKLRWDTISNGELPFGGFPGVDRIQ